MSMTNKAPILRRLWAVLGACVLVWTFAFFLSPAAHAEQLWEAGISVSVDGGEPVRIPAYDVSYENNTYVSLRSMGTALAESQKPYRTTYSFTTANGKRQYETLTVFTGQKETAWPLDPSHSELYYISPDYNELIIDGAERHYKTYRCGSDGDLMISLTDFAMAFDLTVEYGGEDLILIDTTRPFDPGFEYLNSVQYYDTLAGVVCGDITTGELLYTYKAYSSAAIASTSKLMTCFLALDAIDEGRIGMDDTVTVSERTRRISISEDGIIPMETGRQVSFRELMYAMMLPSSNEACVAIAEHVAGSEDAFVEAMNEKARELELSTAVFYNASGLPCYKESMALTKVHNSMSAMDLYRLAEALVKTHPEVLEISSTPYAELKTLNYTAYNTNHLLYNLPGVKGLKTGSTIRAGYCMVTLMEKEVNGETRQIVCVLLDAENGAERMTKSEVLLRCVDTLYEERDG